MRSRILVISGHRDDALHISQMLQELLVSVDYTSTLRQARNELRHKRFDAVLTEATLPDGNWLDVLNMMRDCPGQPQVIVTDPQADAQFWAKALNLGAYDLLRQTFYEPEVRRIFCNVCAGPEVTHATV